MFKIVYNTIKKTNFIQILNIRCSIKPLYCSTQTNMPITFSKCV